MAKPMHAAFPYPRTLEISVVHARGVSTHGMPVGQLIYFTVEGNVENLYNRKPNAK